jgi:pimeloyl-ACP methyl ester carboxylesterase
MRSVRVPAEAGATASMCVVWLPGAYQAAQDFLTAGFARAVESRRRALDLWFVDLELAYMTDRAALDELQSQIVRPARAAGASVWLGGISLGGLLALDFAASHPGELDGLCLVAPYLGSRILMAEIAAAPGLAAWQPGELAQDDDERRIWRYLKSRGTDSRPLLYLGFGRQDRFAAAHELLAAALPPNMVDAVPGGHDWSTWLRLWENFLDSRPA